MREGILICVRAESGAPFSTHSDPFCQGPNDEEGGLVWSRNEDIGSRVPSIFSLFAQGWPRGSLSRQRSSRLPSRGGGHWGPLGLQNMEYRYLSVVDLPCFSALTRMS